MRRYILIILTVGKFLFMGCSSDPYLHSNNNTEQNNQWDPCEELYELLMEECNIDSYQYWDDFFSCDDTLDQWELGRLTCKTIN